MPCGATGIQAAARAHTIQIVIRTSFGQAHLVQADTIEATLIMVLLTQVMLLTSLQLMVCAVSLDLDFFKAKEISEIRIVKKIALCLFDKYTKNPLIS